MRGGDGAFTLFDGKFQNHLITPRAPGTPLHPLATTRAVAIRLEKLHPFRSPLLGASPLVSLPPLIDMLNFSGFPRQHQARLPEVGRLSQKEERTGSWSRRGARAPPENVNRPRGARSRAAPQARGARGQHLIDRWRALDFRLERMCVGRTNDSRDPAIRITFRISRRPSSRHEPSNPSLPLIRNRTEQNTTTQKTARKMAPRKQPTLNDPSAGSPTETLLRLLIPLAKLA